MVDCSTETHRDHLPTEGVSMEGTAEVVTVAGITTTIMGTIVVVIKEVVELEEGLPQPHLAETLTLTSWQLT